MAKNTQIINNSNDINVKSITYSFFQRVVLIANYLKIDGFLVLINNFIYKIISVWLKLMAIIWSSAFLYSMFYYNFIPLVLITKEVYFQYDSTCNRKLDLNCKIPFAEFELSSDSRTGHQLIRGQMYKIDIDLELPESEINWNQGMFMIRIKLFDENKRTFIDVAKPSILKFKSPIMRMIESIFYWPLLVVGFMKESQILTVTLIENLVEGSHQNVGPITDGRIEIEARDIEIYPPTVLRIIAHLNGLKYYMYYYPISSAAFGTSFITIIIYFMACISPSYRTKYKEDSQLDDDVWYDVSNHISGDQLVGSENDSFIGNTRLIQELPFDNHIQY
jgi:seipin